MRVFNYHCKFRHISDVDSGKWRDVDIERYGPDHPKAGQPTGLIKEDVVFHSNDQFYAGETTEQKRKVILDGLDYCLKQVCHHFDTI